MDARRPDRRSLLFSAGAAGLAALARPAAARPEDVDYEIGQILRGATAAEGRVHLDLPRHADGGTSVPMTLRVDGALTAPDRPETVHVLASQNPRPRVLTAHFTPGCGEALVATRIRLEGAQEVHALARMADGSFWRTMARVSVAFGACAQIGEGPPIDDSYQPSIRIAMPASARPGEVIAVRTLISHPMETGFRLDERNLFVPLRIIESFVARVNGEEVLRLGLEPAIATNPYLEFRLLAPGEAVVEFEWTETRGRVWTETRRLAPA